MELKSLTLADLVALFRRSPDATIVVEVSPSPTLYARNRSGNILVDNKKSHSVGRVYQRALDIVEIAQAMGLAVKTYAPQRGNWGTPQFVKRGGKKVANVIENNRRKKEFERCTGWRSGSSYDQRSAAFFWQLEAGR